MNYRNLILALAFTIFSSPLFAQAPSPNAQQKVWPDKVKVGGEFRLRLESQINYDLDDAIPDNDTFLLVRTRVYLDLNPTPWVQLFAMFQDSKTIDQESALVKTPDQRSLYQGFVEFKNVEEDDIRVRAKLGRQELNYGEQRLIGSFDFGNLARSFDGAVLGFSNENFFLDLFGTRLNTTGLEQQFAGAYGQLKNIIDGVIEPYVLYLHNDPDMPGELNLVTFGTRLSGNFHKNFDYGFEGAFQTGTLAENAVSAFATHMRFGYTWNVFSKPRIGMEYNFASGDGNPDEGTVTTFNNLFPTNHDKYGFIDFFSWQNMHDLRGVASFAPLSWLKGEVDYHAFFLPEPADGSFQANGTQFRAGSPTASHFAGQELDLLVKFGPVAKYFDSFIGYSIFFPGQFFADTGSSDIAQYFYAQVQAKY